MVLGHILFKYLSEIFLNIEWNWHAYYADDNALYKACGNVDAVVKTLRMSAEKLFKWFTDNQMQDITDKCPLILSTGNSNEIQTENSLIKGSLFRELLVVS